MRSAQKQRSSVNSKLSVVIASLSHLSMRLHPLLNTRVENRDFSDFQDLDSIFEAFPKHPQLLQIARKSTKKVLKRHKTQTNEHFFKIFEFSIF